MNHKHEDLKYMKKAFELAEQGLFTTGENPRVGCVLVKAGQVIGQGFHLQPGGAHAEVFALQEAGLKAQGSTAYVTLEPCCHHGKTPPCSEALIASGVSRVVIANEDPNPQVAGKGLTQLAAAGITVESGVGADIGLELNPGFFKRMRTGLPFVRCKLAQSIDGRTAMASGESYWITGEVARSDVQYWRARSQAIITGIETVLHDDCRLTVRTEQLPAEYQDKPHFFDQKQPLRVVIDSRLRTPRTSKITAKVTADSNLVIITATNNTAAIEAFENRSIKVLVFPDKQSREPRVNLKAVLKWLGEQGINEVLLESGATLAGAFVQQELVDELLIYTAPVIMGSLGKPLLNIHIDKMADRLHIKNISMQQLGDDWRLRAALLKPDN